MGKGFGPMAGMVASDWESDMHLRAACQPGAGPAMSDI